MKKAFAIFSALVLMPASQTMAWTGGPFSNNSALESGDDGVYEAIATTSNGLGIYRFAVRNNGMSTGGGGGTDGGTLPNGATAGSSNVQFNAGLLSASSSNVWYYKGITYYGPAFGTVNSDAGIVACVGNAQSNQPSTGAIQGQAGNTGEVAQTGEGGINGVVIRGPQGGNIGFANSSFTAKIKNKKTPNVRFRGTGQVSFVGEASVIAEVEAINPVTIEPGGVFSLVDGVGTTVQPRATTQTETIPQGDGNAPVVVETTDEPTIIGGEPGGSTTTATTENITSPSGTSETTITAGGRITSFGSSTLVSTGGEGKDFSQRGHVRKFVVFGSRVSVAVVP